MIYLFGFEFGNNWFDLHFLSLWLAIMAVEFVSNILEFISNMFAVGSTMITKMSQDTSRGYYS